LRKIKEVYMGVEYVQCGFKNIARPGDFIRVKWHEDKGSTNFYNGLVTAVDEGVINIAVWDGELIEEYDITEEDIKNNKVTFETSGELFGSFVKVNFPGESVGTT
jgi:hypothetical protein